MQVYSIDTGLFKLDGGAMFGVVPKTLWQKSIPADENNLCSFAMRCLLVVDGERKILIDTGMGNKQSAKFFSHYFPHGNDSLLESLQRLGFQPEDITDVLLTHLHFDHCGGAVSRINDTLELTFPNALYWSSEAHWQWATKPNAREKASFLSENILPIYEKERLRFVEEKKGEKTSFSPNIDIMFTNGHTRSMMHPLIKIKDKTLAYDMYPMISLEEKENYLEEAVANNHLLFFEHDATTICCTVEKTEKGFRKKETVPLETLI